MVSLDILSKCNKNIQKRTKIIWAHLNELSRTEHATESSLRLRNRTSLLLTLNPHHAPSSHCHPRPAPCDPPSLLTAGISFACFWTLCKGNLPACAPVRLASSILEIHPCCAQLQFIHSRCCLAFCCVSSLQFIHPVSC